MQVTHEECCLQHERTPGPGCGFAARRLREGNLPVVQQPRSRNTHTAARGCRLSSRPSRTANSPSRRGKLMEQERRSSSHTIVETVILPLVAVAFAAAIFAIDTFTSLGLAVAVLYVVASGRRTPCAAA